MGKTYWVYILKCIDGSYYTGSTSNLEKRLSEHQQGAIPGYTHKRRPVKLVFSDYFEEVYDAISAERQIKGWTRAKKEALIRGDFELLKILAKKKWKKT
ncbi:MAG: GIY-YIG nuclease family protein [Candidatus Cloacimonadota bacterium]|nr:MAG: GIY-YIG nuclease family protein [Candidatus Cloacimonadota bacterium]